MIGTTVFLFALALAHEANAAAERHPTLSFSRNVLRPLLYVGFITLGGYGTESILRYLWSRVAG